MVCLSQLLYSQHVTPPPVLRQGAVKEKSHSFIWLSMASWLSSLCSYSLSTHPTVKRLDVDTWRSQQPCWWRNHLQPALFGDLAQLLSDSQLKSYITSTFTTSLWAPLVQVSSILAILQPFSETCWKRRDPSFHMLQKVKTGNLNGQTFFKRRCLLHVSPLLSTFRKQKNVTNDKDKAPPYRPTQILIQFSSVQFTCSVVSDSLWPHELQHARPPCPSPTPGVHSKSHPSSWWCHPAISSSVVPFSFFPQSLPASESFPMSQLFAWGGQSIRVSALALVLQINTQGWSPSEWTGWVSLQSLGLSRVFSNTTVQKHQFFGAQLSSQSNSHIHTWPLEKT